MRDSGTWATAESAVSEGSREPAAGTFRAGSRWVAVGLIAAYLLIAALPVLLARAGDSRPREPFLYEVARAAALVAFNLLALQTVLAARLKILDRVFGLDAVTRFHRRAGLFASFLLLAHPVLLLVSTRGDIPWEWPVAVGAGALLILGAGIFAALSLRILGIDYNRWRLIHKGMALVLVLGYVHSRFMGADLSASRALRAYWAVLLAAGLGIFVWRNTLALRWSRRGFHVLSVAPEARGVFTLTLAPEGGRRMAHRPGQFVFLTLLRPGFASEEHPFTISSAPLPSGLIAVTVKQSGDFTSTIGHTRAGDRALVEGPFGRFSLAHHDAEQFLFVGAGVGITPLASMIRHLRDTGDPRPVLLVCANRAQADIPFRDEWERLPANMRVAHVLSRPEAGWRGASGRLDGEALRALAGPLLARADVYLCGPPAAMRDLARSLRELGVRRRRLHMERFALP
jgi:predicted ferric reductase